jgi:gas vesicle protein
MNTGKALLGILAGVAAGALFGILFAPEKGSETRKKIAKKGKDYVDDLTVKLNDLMEDVSEKVDSVAKKVKDLTVKEPEDFSNVN